MVGMGVTNPLPHLSNLVRAIVLQLQNKTPGKEVLFALLRLVNSWRLNCQ